MTVGLVTWIQRYQGVSGDTKPDGDVRLGSTFYETDTGRWFVWDGDSWERYSYPLLDGQTPLTRAQFVSQLLGIAGDVRLLWLPSEQDTTTATDQSQNGRTITFNASIAERLSRQGFGHKVSFNGTSQYGSTPDVANLSFGNGTNDQAFSIVVLANVTDSAASRAFVCKYAGSAREWLFQVNTSDALLLAVFDESGDWQSTRTSSNPITQGSPHLFGMTYDGTGGATAMNGAVLYQDGLSITSTASNNASYVAMEDTAAVVAIGSLSTLVANFFSGEMALVLVCQKALSAAEHWAIRKLCEGYFDFLG